MSARLFLVLLAVVASGCASGPKFAEIKNSIPALDPEQGRIFFYRPSVIGAAIQPTIQVNGSAVGEMVPMGFFYVDRLPGNYVVSASTESEATLHLRLEANQTQYVKGSISIGILVGRPNLTLVDQMNALIEMQDLGYSGGTPLQAGSGGGAPPPSAAAPPASGGSDTKLKDLEGLLPAAKEKK